MGSIGKSWKRKPAVRLAMTGNQGAFCYIEEVEAMAWEKIGWYGDLPLLIYSGPGTIFDLEPSPVTGEVVGLFLRDQETIEAIRAKDPIILDMFYDMLSEIDKIAPNIYGNLESTDMELPEQDKDSTLPKSGYIYVLRADNGLYKIGRSVNIDGRIKRLETVLPYELELVCAVKAKDYITTEAKLHQVFADKCVKGEWFQLTEADIEYIKGLGAQDGT